MYGDKRRSEPRFSLVIRQQPRRGLAIGNSQMSLRSARSVPIDPPPVCELLIDRSGDEQLLSLPEVFLRAQLVRGDSPTEECLADARRIEPLVGDTLQSPFNSRIDTREDQSFFVFKELGIRNRGVYRLRFDLFDRVGLRIFKIASVYSDAFEVQERRKHPGLSASSALMDALVDRGMKYKLRKANDKQNPKKRKSPEDFYHGDERSLGAAAAAARRQSYGGGGEFEYGARREYGGHSAAQQVARPVAHRAEVGDRIGMEDRFSEMLPPISSTVAQHQRPRLSPTFRAERGDKVPQLPSLTRLGAGLSPTPRSYPPPQLHLSPSLLPPHPQLHASSRSPWTRQHQDEELLHANAPYSTKHLGPTLSPVATDQRPSLEFRSSSSSVATNSTGREAASTPTSSTTESTPFTFNGYPSSDSKSSSSLPVMGLGLHSKAIDAEQHVTAGHRGSISKGPSRGSPSSSSNGGRPTLPPISSLYTPHASTGRRPSAADAAYFGSLSPRSGH